MLIKNHVYTFTLLLSATFFAMAEEPLGSSVKQMIELQTYNPKATQENQELVNSGLGVQTETANQLQRKNYGKTTVKMNTLNSSSTKN